MQYTPRTISQSAGLSSRPRPRQPAPNPVQTNSYPYSTSLHCLGWYLPPPTSSLTIYRTPMRLQTACTASTHIHLPGMAARAGDGSNSGGGLRARGGGGRRCRCGCIPGAPRVHGASRALPCVGWRSGAGWVDVLSCQGALGHGLACDWRVPIQRHPLNISCCTAPPPTHPPLTRQTLPPHAHQWFAPSPTPSDALRTHSPHTSQQDHLSRHSHCMGFWPCR